MKTKLILLLVCLVFRFAGAVYAQRVLIDIGGNANYGGTLTTSPSLNGNFWNNMTDAREGIRVTNAITTTNVPSGINIEVISRVDGTYSPASLGIGNGNTVGIVGDYPASATTDHALVNITATAGKWRIAGLNVNNTYTIKFWGTRSNTTAPRSIEIKRFDETVWQSYNATANTNYTNAAFFTVTGKTQMDFDIRTKAGSDFSAINVLDISYLGPGTPPLNQAPFAIVAADTSLQLPTDSLLLKGCLSYDPENAALKYKWLKIAGPASLSLPNDSLCSVKAKNLVAGLYKFELTVTDTGGLKAKDTLAVAVSSQPPVNLSPVAIAGADTTIQLPTDSVILKGCSSYDPENAALKYKWTKIAGPASLFPANDSVCSVKVKNMVAGLYRFELAVSDPGGLKGRDTVSVAVNAVVTTNWPPPVTALCNSPYKIVVIGSSTAYGTGADPIDSSWVRKYKAYMLQQGQQVTVVNLATPGLSSWEVSPTGTYTPYPFAIDTARNITKALTYQPDAIILSLPSNDIARDVPVDSIHRNFARIVALADAQHVPVWVTTTQPRNGLSPAEETLQMNLRDWINSTYGNKAVDFWSTVANADGTINALYSFGDGVHLNNYGHHVLFTRMVQENLWDSVCLRRGANFPPVARAGNDTIINGNSASFNLNGSRSFDPEGSSLIFSWRLLTTQGCSLSNGAVANPIFSASVAGSFMVELTVRDAAGLTGKDSILIRVVPSNISPVANAGPDQILTLPNHLANLNGSSSTDPDGTITTFRWRKLIGPGSVIISDSMTAQTTIDLSVAGVYTFELKVVDNAGATALDSVNVTLNASTNRPPVSNAGIDKTITLPVASVLLDGRGSTDPEAQQMSYQWLFVSGPSGSQVLNPAKDTTTVKFINSGTYTFRLTVTDAGGLSASDDVNIIVQAASGSAKRIRVNIYGGVNPYADPQWNNWDMAASAASSNFKYSDGTASNVKATITSSALIADNGPGYAPGANVCPPQVLRYNSANTSIRTLSILGLNSNQFYSLELYASRANTGNSTVYQVGNSADTISTSNNVNDYAKFVNLRPDINGKVNVSISRIGTWNYLAGFQLTEQPGNRPPVSNAGVDKSITLPVASILLDGRGSTDPEGQQLSFQWLFVSGPSGSQILNPAKDTTTVKFINSGTYTFRLTVTDAGGLSASDDVNIIAQAATGPAKTIRVNIYGGVNPYTDSQWNNWDMAASVVSTNFKYSDGTASNVNATITSSALIADNGPGYAPGASVCPTQVLRYNSANTSIRTLSILGLNSNQFYSLELYASRANTGNSTVCQVGNSADTISTSNNVNDYAKFSNVRPDINGKINISISRIGTWTYLAGFLLTEQPGAQVWPSNRSNALVEDTVAFNRKTDQLSFYPNPAHDFITVNLPVSIAGKYSIQFYDAAGAMVQKTSGSKLPGINSTRINISKLNKGVYFLQFIYNNNSSTRRIIKL